MTPHRGRLLALLLAAMTPSAASAENGVFVRFKLLEPAETSYYVQIGGHIHVEPWVLPGAVWPAGADKDRTKRVGSGTATDWFDLGKYAGPKLHDRLRLVELSHPVVEAGLYDAPAGTVLVLANFTYRLAFRRRALVSSVSETHVE